MTRGSSANDHSVSADAVRAAVAKVEDATDMVRQAKAAAETVAVDTEIFGIILAPLAKLMLDPMRLTFQAMDATQQGMQELSLTAVLAVARHLTADDWARQRLRLFPGQTPGPAGGGVRDLFGQI